MSNIHLTPAQWIPLVITLVCFLIVLVRSIARRGQPSTPPSYRQGCIGGLMVGLSIGLTVGVFVGMALGMRSMLIR